MKVRQNLYIDRAISDALEALAAGRGGNKSRLVNDALAGWLARRATKEVDDLFRHRLDRLTREMKLMRRDVEVLLESLSLLVRHQLTVTAPFPENDKAALAIGQQRFERFVAQVGHQIAQGRKSLAEPEVAEAGR